MEVQVNTNEEKINDVLIFDEINDYVGEQIETEVVEKPTDDYSVYRQLIEMKGYDVEEFLNDDDIESPEDILTKLHTYDTNKNLEDYFEDEEIKEAILLKKQGKIKSAKDWLNYVKVDDAPVEFTEDSAKEFLKQHYKAIGMRDSLIERNLTLLETNDELLDEAKSISEEHNKSINEKQEARKTEYLARQAEETKKLQLQFQEDLMEMKSFVSEQSWKPELKEYTNKEILHVLEDLNTGKIEKSETLKSVIGALTNKTEAPKLIAYLSKIIVNGKVTMESVAKINTSKAIDQKVIKWKQSVNQEVKGISQPQKRNEFDENVLF